MARSNRTTESVNVYRRTQRFFWPLPLINGWLLIMLACGITFIAVFALNIQQQEYFQVGIPWLFPYGITIGALTVALVFVINVLMISNNIIPGVMIMLSVLFFALYMAGLIETGIQLFGSGGNVNNRCRNSIINNKIEGQSVGTLAWLELYAICNGWYAAFSFWLIGTINLVIMIFIAARVSQAQVDTESNL